MAVLVTFRRLSCGEAASRAVDEDRSPHDRSCLPTWAGGRAPAAGDTLIEIAVIVALVLLNGVFAGAEIAILSLRKTRLNELVEEGSPGAIAVRRLRDQPEAFLATVQIGITVVGATAAAFGGASLTAELATWIARIPWMGRFAEDIAFVLVVGSVSFLTLVLGELVPKSLALRAGETYALLIARPLASLAWVARPVVALLTGASNVVLRLFGDHTTFSEARLSREEVRQLVGEAATAGSVDAASGEIAARALDFSTLDAYTVMVPRADVVMVPRDVDVETLARLVRDCAHSRIPVHGPDPDDVVGFVNARDALAAAVLDVPWSLEPFLHPVLFVPDAMAAPMVLRKLQAARSHLAMVIDEQGTIAGLITMEDLLEELVGEIFSERDRPRAGFPRDPDGAWTIAANRALHDVNRELGVGLPEGDYATVGGLVIAQAGRIPEPGEQVTLAEGVTIEVIEGSARRLRTVRIRRAVAP